MQKTTGELRLLRNRSAMVNMRERSGKLKIALPVATIKIKMNTRRRRERVARKNNQ